MVGGLSVEFSDGVTVLEGFLRDQAELHGLLAALRDIGLPLLAVTPIDTDPDHHHRTETDMTTATTTRPTTTHDSDRAHARAGGTFYLLTFATPIPAALMLGPILNDTGYILPGVLTARSCGRACSTSRVRWRASAAQWPCFP